MQITPHNRWSLALSLIHRWWPPLTALDQVPEAVLTQTEQRLGALLPTALREWYQIAGRRQDFVGDCDYLVPPEELEISDKKLIFCIAHQGAVSWGIELSDLATADPAVLEDVGDFPLGFLLEDQEFVWKGDAEESEPLMDNDTGAYVHIPRWIDIRQTVSRFLTGTIAEATIWSGAFTGRGSLTTESRKVITEIYTHLQSTRADVVDYYGDNHTLIQMIQGEDHIMMAARNRAAMERFLHLTGWDPTQQDVSHNWPWGGHAFNDFCRDLPPPYIVRYPSIDDVGYSDEQWPQCHLNGLETRLYNYRQKDGVKQAYLNARDTPRV